MARLERYLFNADELESSKQRRIVIYVQSRPRLAVASIELLSPSNKTAGSVGQTRYLEKRASALHGGLHWVEIDLLRGGQRPPLAVPLPAPTPYLAYVAQATPTGWNHLLYAWGLRDPLPRLSIPLLGTDQALLDVGRMFSARLTNALPPMTKRTIQIALLLRCWGTRMWPGSTLCCAGTNCAVDDSALQSPCGAT